MYFRKLILIVALLLLPTIFGPSHFKRWIRPLHDSCLSRFSGRTTGLLTHELGSALICGRNLSPGPLKQIFTELGLYHILVVSGAHLTWVTAIIMFLFPSSPLFCFLILALFTLMTGAQAPVLRALLELSLKTPVLPSWAHQLGAFAGCLLFNPQWFNTRSLYLSALARQSIQPNLSPLLMTLRVQLVLTPLLLDFFLPSVQGLLVAGFLSLVLEIFLFPLLLAVALFPEWSRLSEMLLENFLLLLEELHHFLPAQNFDLGARLPWHPFLYWLLASAFLLYLDTQRLRHWYFERIPS